MISISDHPHVPADAAESLQSKGGGMETKPELTDPTAQIS